MKFSEDIFKRATIRGLSQYLLFGESPPDEHRDYTTRIDDAHTRFKKALMQSDTDTSQILDLADEMVGEHIDVFMEIGIQAGILLMLDIFQNINAEKYKDCSNISSQK